MKLTDNTFIKRALVSGAIAAGLLMTNFSTQAAALTDAEAHAIRS
jgi:hypothetical protein